MVKSTRRVLSRQPQRENTKKSHARIKTALRHGRLNVDDEWHFQLQNKRYFVKLTEDGFIQVTGFAVKTFRKRPIGKVHRVPKLMKNLKTHHGSNFKFGSAGKMGCFLSNHHAFRRTKDPNVWKRYSKARAGEQMRNSKGQSLKELIESVEV